LGGDVQILETHQRSDGGVIPLITLTVALDAADTAMLDTGTLAHLDLHVLHRDEKSTFVRLTIRALNSACAADYLAGRLGRSYHETSLTN
jgi:hypothetical protein